MHAKLPLHDLEVVFHCFSGPLEDSQVESGIVLPMLPMASTQVLPFLASAVALVAAQPSIAPHLLQ